MLRPRRTGAGGRTHRPIDRGHCLARRPSAVLAAAVRERVSGLSPACRRDRRGLPKPHYGRGARRPGGTAARVCRQVGRARASQVFLFAGPPCDSPRGMLQSWHRVASGRGHFSVRTSHDLLDTLQAKENFPPRASDVRAGGGEAVCRSRKAHRGPGCIACRE